jgi:hypothetical protein
MDDDSLAKFAVVLSSRAPLTAEKPASVRRLPDGFANPSSEGSRR